MAARTHFCGHTDVVSRTVQRYVLGSPVQIAMSEEHGQTVLEHDKHASAFNAFFVTYAFASWRSAGPGFRVVVYTWFDGAVVDPIEASVMC